MTKKWVKLPGAGQFRGEGDWVEMNQSDATEMEAWQRYKDTGFLPVAEQDERPKT